MALPAVLLGLLAASVHVGSTDAQSSTGEAGEYGYGGDAGAYGDDGASDMMAGECTTIGEYAVSEPSLSSFVETLKVAGIFENAQDPPEPHTILAPNNDAFAAIADVAAGLDPAGLLDVLLLHVIEGAFPASALTDGMKLETHTTGDLTVGVSEDGTITFTAPYGGPLATVVTADVKACAGSIVHVLDAVLVKGPDAPPAPEFPTEE